MKRYIKILLFSLNGMLLLFAISVIALFMKAMYFPKISAYFQKPAICTTTDTLDHVYQSFRLLVYNHCVSVSGTVTNIWKHKDGDMHINLRVDTQYSDTPNLGNKLFADGNLIIEVVCVSAQRHTDEQEACKNYTNHVYIPKIGEHVHVTGQHVLDLLHVWNEIHPAYEITKK